MYSVKLKPKLQNANPTMTLPLTLTLIIQHITLTLMRVTPADSEL